MSEQSDKHCEQTESIADMIPKWFEGWTTEQMLDEALAQIRTIERQRDEFRASLATALGKHLRDISTPSSTAAVPVEVLRDHWLHQIVCDHETKRDMPICACSTVNLGWHENVGAAVEAWIRHITSL